MQNLTYKDAMIKTIAKDLILNLEPLDNIEKNFLNDNNLSLNDFFDKYNILEFRKKVHIDKIGIIKYLSIDNREKCKVGDIIRILNFVFNLELKDNILFLEKTPLLNSDKGIFSKNEIRFLNS